MAPVLPFICEKIYQGLIDDEKKSIHFCDYPESNTKYIDEELEASVDLAKKIIKSVRNLRVKLKLPNKQPLKSVTIISNNENITKQLGLIENLIMNEVNIKEIKIEKNVDQWIDYEFKPNFEILGPSLGKDINKIVKYLKNITDDEKILLLENKTTEVDGITINLEDININLTKKEKIDELDIVGDFCLLLDTELNDDLLMERMSRELVSYIQKERKNQGFDVTDRIKLTIVTNDKFVQSTVENFKTYISNETLTLDLEIKISDTANKVHDRNVEVLINKLANNS
jgi:isoleucyl-tRNA synthetase